MACAKLQKLLAASARASASHSATTSLEQTHQLQCDVMWKTWGKSVPKWHKEWLAVAVAWLVPAVAEMVALAVSPILFIATTGTSILLYYWYSKYDYHQHNRGWAVFFVVLTRECRLMSAHGRYTCVYIYIYTVYAACMCILLLPETDRGFWFPCFTQMYASI